MNAAVNCAGPAPKLVKDLIQVNLTVPRDLAPGFQPAVITVGVSSQFGITMR